MASESENGVNVQTSVDEDDLETIRDAFHEGVCITVLHEHEGMTKTLLFERPHGHIGVTIGAMPGDGDVHLSVTEWEKEPHHECDRWVWVRSQDTNSQPPDR